MLIAAEQSAARSATPDLPADFTDPSHCRTVLLDLLADNHAGFVALEGTRVVGVLCATIGGAHGAIPAEALAVDPALTDPTGVLVALYSRTAPELLAGGAIHHRATHVGLGSLSLGLMNLGFGRSGVYGSQRSRRTVPDTTVRVGTVDDLDSIVALSFVEMEFRFTAPIYSLPHSRSLAGVREHHTQLLAAGAVHLLAHADREDIGLATLEFTSPAPRLCAAGQPYIGPTATYPSYRGRGVGRSLVDAALNWSYQHDFPTVSVDFDSANPLSRPFWLGAGFIPVGYQVARSIHSSYQQRRPSID